MVNTMEWRDGCLVLLDQTKLPLQVEYITCKNHRRVKEAIKRLEVRGAPAIGAAACYGMVLAFNYLWSLSAGLNRAVEEAKAGEAGEALPTREDLEVILKAFKKAEEDLNSARPTAVNLAWGTRLMYSAAEKMAAAELGLSQMSAELLALAHRVYEADIATNKKMGAYGAEIVPQEAVILTHCNAGALATCGWGTALGVIRSAAEQGKLKRVYSDETRPLLQGSRLTAWELMQDNIPVTTITDNMAAWTMKTKGVNLVVVGADRIAANGDTANKIGTYGVALAAKALGIPFYIAAPASTFDFMLATGEGIPIEERQPEEVRSFAGSPSAPTQVEVFNPAFDVTPNGLIAGIITEYGVLRAPYTEAIKNLHNKVLEEEQFTWKV